MGNWSCLFPACGCLMLLMCCVGLRRALLVLPLHGFYLNEDTTLIWRWPTLGRLKARLFLGLGLTAGFTVVWQSLLAFGQGPLLI